MRKKARAAPEWARWTARIGGIAVYFEHKPPRCVDIHFVAGRPSLWVERHPKHSMRFNCDNIPYARWSKTLRAIRPVAAGRGS